MKKTTFRDAEIYETKDGSMIIELINPRSHGELIGIEKQSLAEAQVAVGTKTLLHKHRNTEELYHIVAGHGLMTLGKESFVVAEGDTVCIPPGTPHCIENVGDEMLRILCCCAPAYSHDDTILL